MAIVGLCDMLGDVYVNDSKSFVDRPLCVLLDGISLHLMSVCVELRHMNGTYQPRIM